MATFSELLGGQAAPRFIDHNGKRYECGAQTQKRKTQLERMLEQSHRQALVGTFEGVPPEAAAIALERLSKRALAGDFKFGGSAYTEWLGSPDGLIAHVVAFFGIPEDEAMALALERGQEVGALLMLAILESLSPAQRKAFEAARKAAESAEGGDEGGPGEGAGPNG